MTKGQTMIYGTDKSNYSLKKFFSSSTTFTTIDEQENADVNCLKIQSCKG